MYIIWGKTNEGKEGKVLNGLKLLPSHESSSGVGSCFRVESSDEGQLR